MYCFGDCRRLTFSPRAIRSRSRWRSFSRSSATDFMRLPSVSVASNGMAIVITVATAPTAANTAAMTRVLVMLSVITSSMAFWSEVEIDHFFHDEDAGRHPGRAADQHRAALRLGPQQRDVVRAAEVDQRHHGGRQAADDRGRGFRFHRHGLDLLFHLFAVAQNLGEVAERFRQVAAGALLDRDDDAEEIRLRQRNPLVELG